MDRREIGGGRRAAPAFLIIGNKPHTMEGRPRRYQGGRGCRPLLGGHALKYFQIKQRIIGITEAHKATATEVNLMDNRCEDTPVSHSFEFDRYSGRRGFATPHTLLLYHCNLLFLPGVARHTGKNKCFL